MRYHLELITADPPPSPSTALSTEVITPNPHEKLREATQFVRPIHSVVPELDAAIVTELEIDRGATDEQILCVLQNSGYPVQGIIQELAPPPISLTDALAAVAGIKGVIANTPPLQTSRVRIGLEMGDAATLIPTS